MNIRQTSLLFSALLAFSFISVTTYTLYNLYNLKLKSIETRDSIKTTSLMNRAIIELSLERSVMQVTLNLETPIQKQFKDLLDGQRTKSEDGFKDLVATVQKHKSLRRGEEFLSDVQQISNKVTVIRKKADEELSVPLSQRDPSEVKTLPTELKAEILEYSILPIKLLPENAELPSIINVLEKIQYNAWAIREYGGRERTYFAIATATGRYFDESTRMEMSDYHAKALEAISELELLSGYSGLDPEIVNLIQNVKNAYFVDYDKVRRALLESSEKQVPYTITFSDFFTQSSAALDTAVRLSYTAGDEMVAYMEQDGAKSILMFWIFVAVLAMVVLICGFQMYYTQFKVSNRILSLAEIMNALINGNLNVDLSKLKSTDEIGKMADHVEVFKQNAIQVKKLEADQLEQKRQAEEAKKIAANELANSFEERIGSIVEEVEQAANELNIMSSNLSDAISQTSMQSSSVASASFEASTNVEIVANSAGQMSSSIMQISNDVINAAQKAKECAQSAETSQVNLEKLKISVEEIDSVIQAINNVAEQTNLLALNATIEAARAGESGKGFAVVASEVKSLANETHKMTEEISQKVSDVKDNAQRTINNVNDIISQINSVDEKTNIIADAIQQQSNITQEISQSVAQAADGTSDVSKNIEEIQKAANRSAESTESLKILAGNLLTQASQLKTSIQTFLGEIRQA